MRTSLSLPGSLPVSPVRFATNHVTEEVFTAVDTAIATNSIGIISGPPGVGKTTCAAISGAEVGSRVVYVDITTRASARQNLVNMFESVSGTPARGTAAQIQADLHDHLLRHPTTMLVDDAHHIGRDGLILIKGLFDLVATTRGEGTPIILIGNVLQRHLDTRLPELVSRSNGRADARPLTSQEMVEAIHVIQPRTRNNDTQVLLGLDSVYLEGNQRKWDQLFLTLDKFVAPSLTEPYRERDIKEALKRSGLLKNTRVAA